MLSELARRPLHLAGLVLSCGGDWEYGNIRDQQDTLTRNLRPVIIYTCPISPTKIINYIFLRLGPPYSRMPNSLNTLAGSCMRWADFAHRKIYSGDNESHVLTRYCQSGNFTPYGLTLTQVAHVVGK